MGRKKKKVETIEVVKDWGEWNVPESWDEITLKQMQEINKLTKEGGENFDMYKCLFILCGKTQKEVDELPLPFFESICNRMIFLKTTPPEHKPQPYTEIDGQRYQVNLVNDLTVGEYTAVDAVLRTDEDNLATILAILCRKPDEAFDKNYQDNILEDRIKLWENAKMTDVQPVINFFLQLWAISEEITHIHLAAQESIDLIVKDIENSPKNGDSHLSYWKKRKLLKKLKKLRNQIS